MDFLEFFIQTEYVNIFVRELIDLSYKSQFSFWSLILTIISNASTEYSEKILSDQFLINHLFLFLRFAGKDFTLSHIDYLIESSIKYYYLLKNKYMKIANLVINDFRIIYY